MRVVNAKGKARTFAGVRGRRNDTKKAYVSLEAGYDINFVGEKV